MLYIEVEDDLGINTTGLGIGRELTAILNGNERNPISLNDFYRAVAGSSQKGIIEYPLRNLPNGTYTVRVRVWDVANNATDAYTTFRVQGGSVPTLENIRVYPNPFTERLTFAFSHNLRDTEGEVELLIHDAAGRRVQTLKTQLSPNTSTSQDLVWEGNDAQGGTVTGGVYTYELRAKNSRTGEIFSHFGKVVYIR
jgi:predicted phage tail protein